MRFPQYHYEIDDRKYDARVSLFEYLIGIYTALIAASLVGFEKAVTIVGKDLDDFQAVSNLSAAVIVLLFAAAQGILVIALSYHHKYYNSAFLKEHREKFFKMTPGKSRTFWGICIYIEHLWAVVTTAGVRILAGTWYILPLIALYYLSIAFNGIVP